MLFKYLYKKIKKIYKKYIKKRKKEKKGRATTVEWITFCSTSSRGFMKGTEGGGESSVSAFGEFS